MTSQRMLRAPEARQGPGPMPEAMVDALDLVLTRAVARALPGDRRALGVGSGTELAQLRPYREGDDVRHLDAAATARTREPHVRLHVPERTLTTWLVLDVSPSMAFGTQDRLKSDVADGVASVIGRLAIRRAGAIGVVRFGDGAVRVTPPRASKPGLVAVRRAVEEGVVADGAGRPGAMAEALGRLGRIARSPGLVVLVSDFREPVGSWLSALGRLRMRHGVLAVEVHDPREGELPAAGVLALVDPETGRRAEVDTSSARVRERFRAIEARRRADLHAELRRLQVPHVPLSTAGDWLVALGRALRA